MEALAEGAPGARGSAQLVQTARLKELFAAWSERDLSQERYAIVFLDGMYLKVRMARRVVSVPLLAALGVAEDGTKRLVALRLAVSEAGEHWKGLAQDLRKCSVYPGA